MAKKRSGSYPARKSAGYGKNSTSGMWRLSLIVFAIVCFRMLEIAGIRSLEFVRTLPDAWGVADYNINFAVLGMSVAGLSMLLFSGPSKNGLNVAGGILLLCPLWLRCGYFTGGIGAQALSLTGFDPASTAVSLVASLLFICMVHGADRKLQLIAALAAIAEYAALYFMEDFPLDWEQLAIINGFAVFAGLSMDYAWSGYSHSTLLPAAVIIAEFMLKYADLEPDTVAYITMAASGVCLAALAGSAKLRKGAYGIFCALAAIAVTAVTLLFKGNTPLL